MTKLYFDPNNDKAKHFFAGLIISFIFSFISLPVGLLVATIAGAVKELYDLTGKGTPEWADFFVTIGGGVAGMLLNTIVTRIF